MFRPHTTMKCSEQLLVLPYPAPIPLRARSPWCPLWKLPSQNRTNMCDPCKDGWLNYTSCGKGLCSAYISWTNEHDSRALDLRWVSLLGKQQAFRDQIRKTIQQRLEVPGTKKLTSVSDPQKKRVRCRKSSPGGGFPLATPTIGFVVSWGT